MTSYVLVHGAWHGGWCWRAVCKQLRAMGHDVFTPTLTGLGERRHLLSKSVSLALHVEDVCNGLFFEDLDDVVLVGHSYAGLVISGVANKQPDRIRQLVYLDASLPDDGKRIIDLLPSARREKLKMALQRGELCEAPVLQANPFGVSDAASIDWLTERLVAHPMTHDMLYEEIPSLTSEAQQIPRSFINCTMDPDLTRRGELLDKGFQYQEIATGHDAMITAPDELVALLQA